MVIDIKGHSGCNIDIIEDNGKLYVKKSTDDLKYLDRLKLQAEKQKNDNYYEKESVCFSVALLFDIGSC